MADVSKFFSVIDGISFDDNIGTFYGSNDPSIGAGETAPIGSVYFRTNGISYRKFGSNDTDWIPIGNILQRASGNIAGNSGTTWIPIDDSLPQINEGTEVWSINITPQLQNSIMEITISATIDTNKKNNPVIGALFRNNTCIGTTIQMVDSQNGQMNTAIFRDTPNTTNNVNYSFRFGKGGQWNGTWFFARSSISNNLFDNTIIGNYTITEVSE